MNKDQKLLHQLGFSDEQILTVKTSGSGTPSGSSADSSTSSSSGSSGIFSSSYAMEQVLSDTVHFKHKNLIIFIFLPTAHIDWGRCVLSSQTNFWLFRTASLRSSGLHLGEDTWFVNLVNHTEPSESLNHSARPLSLLLSYISLCWFFDFLSTGSSPLAFKYAVLFLLSLKNSSAQFHH